MGTVSVLITELFYKLSLEVLCIANYSSQFIGVLFVGYTAATHFHYYSLQQCMRGANSY